MRIDARRNLLVFENGRRFGFQGWEESDFAYPDDGKFYVVVAVKKLRF